MKQRDTSKSAELTELFETLDKSNQEYALMLLQTLKFAQSHYTRPDTNNKKDNE
ncbi:hypothetical protein [Paenibacillus massiliensis]|uniref:hypothetical protein n=1 Tax=Paenibacillus massiliensis TaxID=225917 RepID=UPI0012DF3688|nr:hypothetical protein [Paenibacillus massiliensis]